MADPSRDYYQPKPAQYQQPYVPTPVYQAPAYSAPAYAPAKQVAYQPKDSYAHEEQHVANPSVATAEDFEKVRTKLILK